MDTNTSHKMAIIGAGPVGLAMARALKQNGIAYDQFDARSQVGGNWVDGVYDSAHIISSRKTTEFTEFPMPADWPDFPSAAQMREYLNNYAKQFDLFAHIALNTCIERVRPVENNLWELAFDTGETRLYKGVLVCNGHHWAKRYPQYEGTFTGKMLHSKDYKNAEQIKGKRVLVIGGGNSACDVASEAGRVADEAHLSLRRGYWFTPKTFFGIPTIELMLPWLPVWIQRIMFYGLLAITVGDYRRYGLPQPDHKLFEHHPTINSELLHYVKHGRVKPHPDIKRFNGNRVEFVDGSSIEVDTVICATGFHVSFPFLPEGLVEVKGVIPQLVSGTLHPDYRGLYIIGTLQPRYGFGPLASIGADLVALIIKLQDQLPYPIGRLAQKIGMKIPTEHLVDPHAALRSTRQSLRMLPLLVKYRRLVMPDTLHINTPIK